MPCLRIRIPGRGETTHVVSGERVSIGRHPRNAIQILDRSVSAFHAELLATEGHYRVRDLQSTNCTLLAGKPVTEHRLTERCTLTFGNVECDYDPEPAADLPELSPGQMQQELHFLRSENAELRERIRALDRRIEILHNAQLIGEKRVHKKNVEALEAELERTREELAVALRARDAARTAAGMLHTEKASILREIRASGIQPAPIQRR